MTEQMEDTAANVGHKKRNLDMHEELKEHFGHGKYQAHNYDTGKTAGRYTVHLKKHKDAKAAKNAMKEAHKILRKHGFKHKTSTTEDGGSEHRYLHSDGTKVTLEHGPSTSGKGHYTKAFFRHPDIEVKPPA